MDKKQVLLQELAIVRKNICDGKAEINLVKSVQYETGQYESVKNFRAMQKNLSEHVLRQDQINAELSALKSKQQGHLHKHFMDVCREEIEKEDFTWILNEAKKRTEESDSPESATGTSINTHVTP